MKKQYDLTKLTDELSNSVFFQEPEKAPKHQVTKAPEVQSDVAPSSQTTKETKQESTKALEDQSTKAGSNSPAQAPTVQSTKARRHFSSYLRPETYKAWKLLATQREVNDYEVLQEALEQYLEQNST